MISPCVAPGRAASIMASMAAEPSKDAWRRMAISAGDFTIAASRPTWRRRESKDTPGSARCSSLKDTKRDDVAPRKPDPAAAQPALLETLHHAGA